MANRKTYTIYRNDKPWFSFMQRGFADGAMAAISALYNLPEKYVLKCDQTSEVLKEWGSNKVVVNTKHERGKDVNE